MELQHLEHIVNLAHVGKGDSDRHAIVLFAIALASRGKTYLELGVRDGTSTLPILMAAHLNEGALFSVDIEETSFVCPEPYKNNWHFVKSDAIAFLDKWDSSKKGFIREVCT